MHCAEHTVNRRDRPVPILNGPSLPGHSWFRFVLSLTASRIWLWLIFSRLIEVVPIRSTTAATLNNHIQSVFSRFGLSEVFISLNVHKSFEFAHFMNDFSINPCDFQPTVSAEQRLEVVGWRSHGSIVGCMEVTWVDLSVQCKLFRPY